MGDRPDPAQIEADDRPVVARGYRVQFEPAQDTYVLLYPEGMVTLNPSAAAILERCDGQRSVADICANLSAAFDGVDVSEDVYQFVKLALVQGWISMR